MFQDTLLQEKPGISLVPADMHTTPPQRTQYHALTQIRLPDNIKAKEEEGKAIANAITRQKAKGKNTTALASEGILLRASQAQSKPDFAPYHHRILTPYFTLCVVSRQGVGSEMAMA
jgi:hypothetical protein